MTIDFDYKVQSGINSGKTIKQIFVESISPYPDKCWNWAKKKHSNGYGCFYYKGKYLLAHRVAFELYNGIPPDGVVMHSCDNRMCVNPNHLKVGTTKDNVDDKVKKGRTAKNRGFRGGMCKLSDAEVREIVSSRNAGESCKSLASRFDVTSTCISYISRGLERSYVFEEDHMTLEEYVKLAMRTNNDMGFDMNVVHAAMLLATESGEIMSEVKRMFAYGKQLDRFNIEEELGDVLWGVALMCHTLDIRIEDVMKKNIKKLEARYPAGHFDSSKALDRDPESEIEAMKR